jgi:hypothetical protein
MKRVTLTYMTKEEIIHSTLDVSSVGDDLVCFSYRGSETEPSGRKTIECKGLEEFVVEKVKEHYRNAPIRKLNLIVSYDFGGNKE